MPSLHGPRVLGKAMCFHVGQIPQHTPSEGGGGLKPETQNNIVPLFGFLLWFLFSLSIFSTFTATSQPLSVMSEPAASSLIRVIPSLRDLRIRTTAKMGRDVNALAGSSV